MTKCQQLPTLCGGDTDSLRSSQNFPVCLKTVLSSPLPPPPPIQKFHS